MEIVYEDSELLRRDPDGKEVWRASINADNCADLVGVTEIDGRKLHPGSVALCGKDGEACYLATDGKWYKQKNGTEVTD